MKYLLLLLTLILFTGCQKQPVSLQHMTKQTRVGIVSTGLDEMKIQTVHGRSKFAQIDISEMNLDRIFEQKLITKLSKINMKPLRVSIYADKEMKVAQNIDEFKYEFRSFWKGLYYYGKQERWKQKGKSGAHPVYAMTKEANHVALFTKNHLNYLILNVEPYVYNQGLQSQIRIGNPLIGKPYILFEPMVPLQILKEGKPSLITRLDNKGYRQVDVYHNKAWQNDGKLELTPKIKQEIKDIILKQMDKVVEDVYNSMVRYQKKK